MDYEQKFLLFKKLIDKTFSSYEKKYSVNFLNKTYQVEFILADRIINLTILPDSEWHELKKKLKRIFLILRLTDLNVRFVLIKRVM